jgi:transposase
MLYGAIDLHLRRSQIRIIDEHGHVVLERRIDTTAAAVAGLFGSQPPMPVLLESSTDSEWVAQRLEACGHEVIVADPNYVAMYGTRTRRIKTDRRDVAALADACRLGIYRRAHRVVAAQRRRRQTLHVRRQLIRIRTQLVNLLRATLRQEGLRLPPGTATTAAQRIGRVPLPGDVASVLAPLARLLTDLEGHIRTANAAITSDAAREPAVRTLQTLPGVGPVVALTFHATLDTPARFGGDARRATAFVGVVPAERSSGERQQKGRITKRGSRELRAMLVQASWCIWRSRTPATQALRGWAHALATRRGRRIAIVALARRLTRILFAMWRDGTPFRSAPSTGPMDARTAVSAV